MKSFVAVVALSVALLVDAQSRLNTWTRRRIVSAGCRPHQARARWILCGRVCRSYWSAHANAPTSIYRALKRIELDGIRRSYWSGNLVLAEEAVG